MAGPYRSTGRNRFTTVMESWARALMESLRCAPLFADDLPEARVLNRDLLGSPNAGVSLNFGQKLGHLYEDALGHLLGQSEQLTLVDSHIQVVDPEGIKVGEMDFLVRDRRSGHCFQLELAVKFYLAHQTDDGWCYPGPNSRDNWPRKLARLQTHQLRLGQHPDALDLLEKRYGITKLGARQLIYGRIFSPMAGQPCPLPEAVSPGVMRGRWLHRSQWREFMGHADQLRVIPKPLWPAVLTNDLIELLPLVGVDELHGLAQSRCTMFVAGQSTEPLFLVPDAWPQNPRPVGYHNVS